MISVVKYDTEQEAQNIIQQKNALGLVLVEVSNVLEGNFLAFSDETTPPITPLEVQLDALKAENASLRQQVGQANADFTAFTDFYASKFPEQFL